MKTLHVSVTKIRLLMLINKLMATSVTYVKLINASTVLCRMYSFLDHMARIVTANVLMEGLNGIITR
jgi:hypothetical protein